MDKFENNNNKKTPKDLNGDSDNVVDIAIARMKTGAVVKEERKSRFKVVALIALAIAAMAAFSQLDFVYQSPVSETAANGDIVITLKQGQSGHYFATGKINDETVKFLVDTGATTVSIPMNVAKRLNLTLGQKRRTITANGYGTSYETKIDSIQLGEIVLTNIDASVTEGLTGEEALLGMSFLKRTRVEQENGVMKIIY